VEQLTFGISVVALKCYWVLYKAKILLQIPLLAGAKLMLLNII